jgi:CelD/BcsL family acetyltransferase involved in cellulose biosynthesis
VEVARDAESLRRVLTAWEDLASHALEPNPLYEPWMLQPALQARVAKDVCCALVWTGDARSPAAGRQLSGLFPLQRLPRFKGLPVTVLSSWRHPSWPLGTPLIRKETAHQCLEALLDWVRAGGERTSLVEFARIPCDGAFHGALADVLRHHDSIAVTTASFTRALLRKGSDGESHPVAALSRQSRKSLRRKERRLSERGAVSHVVLHAEDDVGRWIDDFLRLEASGWKGRRGSALACRGEDRRFAAEVLAGAFRRGRLQIVGLDFEGRPIARCCNLLAGQGSYAYRCAYDEDFAHFSPGVMAEVDTIRAFYALPGVQWMDSVTSPDNATLNRLWNDRRTMQTVLVGLGAWGGLWASVLPLLRWAKRCCAGRLTARNPAYTSSRRFRKEGGHEVDSA